MERKKFLELIPWAFMCALGVIVGSPPPKLVAKPNPKDPLRCGQWSTCYAKAGNPSVLLSWCLKSCPPPYATETRP